MGIKRWLHAKIGTATLGLFFRCGCDSCRVHWSVWGTVADALTSLRRHGVDYHGGVDLTD
jgi:hypothetical protein